MTFVAHHDKPITDDLVRSLMARYRRGRVDHGMDRLVTDEEEAAELARWKDHPWGFVMLPLYYPKPHAPGRHAPDGTAEIAVHVRASARFGLDGLDVRIQLFERERERWFLVNALGARIDYDDAFHVAWFLDKVHLALPVFEPDFGFFDVWVNVARNLGEDPRRRVWPVLLYGPDMVARMGGRERLLEAPAWRVEELSYGAIWLQVAENPALATETELARLADYLGLEP